MAKIENKDIIEALKEKTILEIKELVTVFVEEPASSTAPPVGAATATALGSTPNSSFIISTNSLISR